MMAASWTCLRCKQQIPGGMLSFLVTAGHFFVTKDSRSFKVAHDAHEALCAGCVEAMIKAGEAPADPADPEPEPACAECSDPILAGEDVFCRGCFDEKFPALLAAGGEVRV